MSGFHSSAPLTGALLASKGAAAPSRSVNSFMDGLTEDAVSPDAASPANPAPVDNASVKEAAPVQASSGPVQQDDPVPSGLKSSGIKPEVKPSSKKERIKLSLRLEEEQHLRLKLAAAHLRQSSQTILLAALDDYLNRNVPDIRGGDCNCLMSESQDRDTSRLYHGEPYGNAD